jgi:Ser/Thr protein kinase RdoA (MazF antagonist)
MSGQVADLTRQRLIRHGLAAAVALVERLGLPSSHHVVLSNRGNLIVHFPVAALVARVATLTAWTRREPFQWLAREVAVARHVAGRGGPVVPPARGADPGPHWQDGFAISLWEHAGSPGAPEPSQAECGVLLARFHEAARDCPAELGDLSPVTEQVTDALAVIEREHLADAAALARLRAVQARVLDDISRACAEAPRLVLHGDAHDRNMLRAAQGRSGWVWADLEETTRGPAGWDLATLTSRYDEAGTRAALDAYAAEAGAAVPGPEALAPFRAARDLEATVWLVCMAHLYPERYAALAQASLARALN